MSARVSEKNLFLLTIPIYYCTRLILSGVVPRRTIFFISKCDCIARRCTPSSSHAARQLVVISNYAKLYTRHSPSLENTTSFRCQSTTLMHIGYMRHLWKLVEFFIGNFLEKKLVKEDTRLVSKLKLQQIL